MDTEMRESDSEAVHSSSTITIIVSSPAQAAVATDMVSAVEQVRDKDQQNSAESSTVPMTEVVSDGEHKSSPHDAASDGGAAAAHAELVNDMNDDDHEIVHETTSVAVCAPHQPVIGADVDSDDDGPSLAALKCERVAELKALTAARDLCGLVEDDGVPSSL
jgi:hypothetical protein